MESSRPQPPAQNLTPTANREDVGIPLDAFTLSILRMGLVGLMLGGSAMTLLLLTLHEDQTGRLIGPLSFVLVAVIGWLLLTLGKDRASLVFATYGSWAVATGIMATSGGVMANTVILFPLIILMAGWMLGLRSAIIIASLSSLAVLTVAALEATGIVVHRWPSSPFLYWLADTAAFALAVGVIVFLRRAHHRHVAEVRTLTAALERERADARAADALRRHKELLDHTGRLAGVGGWEYHVATRELNWTDETFRLHDLEPGDMPGVEHAVSFYPPEVRQTITEAVRQAIENGVGYDLELPLDTAKGRRIWVRTIGQPQIEDGRVVRLSGALQDITDHRQADDELKDSLNNLKCTLEATGDGIFGYDGNDPSGRLLFANDRFFEIWNIPPEQATSTGRDEIIAAARRLFPDPDAGVRRIQEILALADVHEDKVPLNDGRVLFRRSIPLLAGSQVSRVWSFRDITAEERAKAELIASRDEAQRANAAKSEFLSRMSHELRTPMHAIMGMMSLARRRMEDAKGLEHLDKAKAAADHLLSVINDILDISKIEAGRLELEQVDFQLADVLRNLENLVAGKAAEKGLMLSMGHDAQLGAQTLRGDPLRIGQILLNLVGNAIKFSTQGSIEVRVRLLDDSGDGPCLRFEVSDQGIGIAPETQHRLFVAFEQADGSMTRKFGGTGLGLAISKRLVQMMDGEIGVDSTPGKGSSFWFTVRLAGLPATTPTNTLPADTNPGEQKLLQRFAGARILLADDDPVGREVALAMLHDAGLAVDTAEDGAVALHLAQSSRYDLILMDMRMPNMNGVEAAAAIRAASLNQDTPIVAMTANAFAEDRRICLEAGMNDHIAKPVASRVLFATLLHWLSQTPAGR
jgi:signal transduction histidine kinase/ActR/RegA family two-component response regulator